MELGRNNRYNPLDAIRSLAVGIALSLAGCATHEDSNALYDYYFPKRGAYVESTVYRPNFDKLLFGPPPSENKVTHEFVGGSLESMIAWNKHSFPKTRSLYSYRRSPPA